MVNRQLLIVEGYVGAVSGRVHNILTDLGIGVSGKSRISWLGDDVTLGMTLATMSQRLC